MGTVIQLGTLERVSLKDAWPTEDGNFTPWLAEANSIALLGEALGIGLEIEAVEQKVGSFRADIIARSTDEAEHRVIIENQFGRTDHSHLGQIMTYLAGVEDTKTIVWIAETIQPDHRAAIDWLNDNTTENYSFFAIEVELWRIGNSAPAARFNVIASPNDWTRNTRTAARQAVDKDSAAVHQIRLVYWSAFAEYLKNHNSTFKIRRPNRDHWHSFSIGRGGFVISATISAILQRIGVELYISDDAGKFFFKALLAQKNEIEQQFGEPLEWQELPGKKGSRVVIYRLNVDPSDQTQFADLQAWMMEKMESFRSVFGNRVKALPQAGVAESEIDDVPEE